MRYPVYSVIKPTLKFTFDPKLKNGLEMHNISVLVVALSDKWVLFENRLRILLFKVTGVSVQSGLDFILVLPSIYL